MSLCAHVMRAPWVLALYTMMSWRWKNSVVHLAVGKLKAVETFTYHNGLSVPYPHGHHCNVELAQRSQRRLRRPWIPDWLKTRSNHSLNLEDHASFLKSH
jgi:hypothetical protein